MGDRWREEEELLYGAPRQRPVMEDPLIAEEVGRANSVAHLARQNALIANGGPPVWLGALARPAVMRSKREHGPMGIDPLRAGSEAMQVADRAGVLLDAYRKAQARRLMDQLFLGPMVAKR